MSEELTPENADPNTPEALGESGKFQNGKPVMSLCCTQVLTSLGNPRLHDEGHTLRCICGREWEVVSAQKEGSYWESTQPEPFLQWGGAL